MNSAHSMPSPVSPYDGQSKQSFAAHRPYYPATPNPESMSPHTHHQASTQQEQTRGLGLYSMPPQHQSTISPIMASPQSEWHSPQPQHVQQEFSAPQQPDMISASAFDPFYGFSNASNTGMVGTHSPEAPALEFCHSPPSSNMQSHRGSVSSSGAPSETSDQAYTPRPVKGEEAWYAGTGSDMHRAISQAPLSYTPEVVTLGSQADGILYRPHPVEWAKQEPSGYISEQYSPADTRLPPMGVPSVLPSVTRQKSKRKKTTREEATHECDVCGKFFKRSYNYKSHLDTHNPDRKYPHPCTHKVGNTTPCTKKFQRKTDLDRHVDSVHFKTRNHKCPLCGNRFARRDTLRRHTEDGCPKRFELGLREGSNANSGSGPAPASGPQPQRYNTYPSPAPDYSSRPRSFSQTASMAPPPPVTTAYSMYTTPAPSFRI